MNAREYAGATRVPTGALPGERSDRYLARLRRELVRLILVAGWFLFASAPIAWAQGSPSNGTVTVSISKDSAALTAGDWVEFNTELRNDGPTATPPLAAHLSIAALAAGKHVDPEDWSPQRTQFLPPLRPGESMELSWRLHALLDGAFASFVTVVSTEEALPPAVSPSFRLQVAPDKILPWNDVIPVVAVVPFFPLALLVLAVAYSRRR